ncbi:MAG: hypothetical protein J0L99_14905 [Chitinophagales bacterium]|jgi:hypothetical protein|nr:hypothetical protein [Chitinophagales bacterium]
MSLRKATRLEEIYKVFSGEPLSVEDLDQFYCRTSEARGDHNPRRTLARVLRSNEDKNLHYLFVGYKGCGKSTEMNHLQKDLQNDFLVLNYSIQQELDPAHLSYIEIFIVTMERLFTVALEQNIPIRDEYLTRIQSWISTKEIQEIRDKYNITGEAEIGADGKLGIPYFQQFFHKFKVSAKSSRSLKEVLKTNVEPKLSDLLDQCNDLLWEIRIKLRKQGKHDLLIIIEDLDKIPLDRAQDLFVNYASQLTLLKANVIFTFPIALYHSPRFNEIKAHFHDVYELPMISVVNKDGSVNPPGFEAMQQIVSLRMEPGRLLEDPSILSGMIFKSGGVLRDLFLFIRNAAEFALDQDRGIITIKDWERAQQKLRKEYANNIAEDYEEENGLKVEDYYKVLVELAQSKTKQLDNTTAAMRLRQNLCILGYNGEGWCDVHPLVKDVLRERGKL